MTEIIRVAEQIGIDIVLTGVFVLVMFVFGWHVARDATCGDGFRTAARRLRSLLGGTSDGSKIIAAEAKTAVLPEETSNRASDDWSGIRINFVTMVAMLALAAMTGRLFTLVGDEILDADFIESWVFLYVPNLDDWGEKEKEWDNEDKLKRKALEDALEWSRFNARAHYLLARHVDEQRQPQAAEPKQHRAGKEGSEGGNEAPIACAHESRTDCARAFFQHAQAVIRQRGGDYTRGLIARETSIAEFLSVVFVSIWGLILVALFGPFAKSAMHLVKKPSSATGAAFVANAAFIAWLWIAQGVGLRLWTEQTKSLDRKIIYSYIAVTEGKDPAMYLDAVTDAQDGTPRQRPAEMAAASSAK